MGSDVAWCLVAAAAALLIGGCADDSADTRHATGHAAGDEATVTVRLVIPDGHIREPEASCSGAGAYRFAHPEASFAIEDGTGARRATGTLPHGTAEKAAMVEAGESRQPTVCVMMIEVPGLETVDGHVFILSDRRPVPILANPDLDGPAEVVLP
ncbi:hypothetical protein G1H11_03660 [Phytoactinopolyspora alkaliphila]|uniref:Uncharacterized protein n=1 Tax=Phytoactinopolyspora alkaliphila TaxID=1783498 RepID=A0A6N9YHG1_9ACTN|nr:hypothetical protein [Phytoactinopolyspora alkaliphila]NED94404.1 hypothetical protein [Phytoactinopolyspora alkaliphila]